MIFYRKIPHLHLTFYGGEPLLRADLIERIVCEAPVQRFMMQTNGVLLDRLHPDIINRFSTILVSLDGRESLTDANRGTGTYRKVIENIKKIRHNGYRHELIARMTVNESSDIADGVHWLADNPDFSFSSIHWQLDANFADDFSHRRFADWVFENYNPGILRLVEDWVDLMENEGQSAALVSIPRSHGRPASWTPEQAEMWGRTFKLQYNDGWPYCTLPGHDWNVKILRRAYTEFRPS